jgi:hypothetical protein
MKTYTFYACYYEFENKDYSLRHAENLALEEWRAALDHNKVPPISGARITFTTYEFSKYPYQELLKNWIWKNFSNSFGDLCSFGEYFYTVEDLIARLDKEKKLMELRVEVDE